MRYYDITHCPLTFLQALLQPRVTADVFFSTQHPVYRVHDTSDLPNVSILDAGKTTAHMPILTFH